MRTVNKHYYGGDCRKAENFTGRYYTVNYTAHKEEKMCKTHKITGATAGLQCGDQRFLFVLFVPEKWNE